MELNPRETHTIVRRTVLSPVSLEEGMRRLAAYCHVKHPHAVWGDILKLDARRDADELTRWLEEVLATEPPTPSISVLSFELYSAVLRNGTEIAAMYLSGSTDFNAEGPSQDWSGWTPDTYLPAGRYAKSQLLRDISNYARGAGAPELGQHVMCLGYACLAVRDACNRISPKILLGPRSSRAVAVGFDEGDLIVLRPLDPLE